jgi:hypothetical protein
MHKDQPAGYKVGEKSLTEWYFKRLNCYLITVVYLHNYIPLSDMKQ